MALNYISKTPVPLSYRFCQFYEFVRFVKEKIRQESSSCIGKKDHRSVKWNCFCIISISIFQRSGYQESVISTVTNGMVGILDWSFQIHQVQIPIWLSWSQVSIGIRSSYSTNVSILYWSDVIYRVTCLVFSISLIYIHI